MEYYVRKLEWKKQKFADWVKTTKENEQDPNFTLKEIKQEPSSLLIPDFEEISDAEAFIEEVKPHLFELMLNDWYTDTNSWPSDRSNYQLREWFDLHYSSLVFDLDFKTELEHQ